MAGFSSITGDPLGSVMNANNVSFDGTTRGGVVTLDGQLLIGSTTLPHIRVNTLTAGAGITITNGSGAIMISVNNAVVGETITGDSGGALIPTAGNWNILGQQAGTIAVMDTVGTAPSTLRIEDRTSPSKFVVDSSTTVGLRGTYSTIQSAITAATAGDTVIVRPGQYTENITLKSGVNISGFSAEGGSGARTNIIGKLIDGGDPVGVTLTNINFTTNSDNIIALTGSGSAVVFSDCRLNCSNNTGISVATGTNVFMYDCVSDLGTTGIGFFTGAGGVSLYDSVFQNSGSSLTASTTSGTVVIYNCTMASVLSTSSAGGYTAYNSIFGLTALNTTALTTAGTGTSNIYNCELFSGTASAISIGVGTTVNCNQCIISSSNTNAITGAGTLTYSGLSFISTSSVINPTTSTASYMNLGKWKASGQPSFNAYLNADASNVTGDGTNYTIIWNTTTFDRNSNFNTSTGTFTAPVTGIYQFNVTIQANGLSAADTDFVAALVTTGQTYNIARETISVTISSNTIIRNYSVLVPMTAADTATVTILIAGSTKTANITGAIGRSTFSGFLVG